MMNKEIWMDGIKSLKDGGSFSFKAAANMTTANFVSSQSQFINPQVEGVIPLASEDQVLILDYLPVVAVTSGSLVIVEQASDDQDAGGVATVAEGAAKETIDFDLKPAYKSFTKYAVTVKVSEEMLEDIPFMQRQIEVVGRRRLRNKISADIITALAAVTPTVLDTNLTAGQLVTLTPHILPAIYADMFILKGYQMNLWLANSPIYGKIFNDNSAATDNGWMSLNRPNIIPCGNINNAKIMAINTNMFPIYVREGINATIGRSSDDFTKNFYSINIEARVAWNFAGECLNAIYHDSVADTITQA